MIREISGFSIFLAGIIGGIRFKKINPTFYPFLYLIWIGCLNELLSFIFIRTGRHTIVNNNIYVLLEPLLITWFFKCLGAFRRRPSLFVVFQVCFVITWVAGSLFWRHITELSLGYRVFYSFIIVLLSIHIINLLLTANTAHLLKNATFLICIGFIAYFTLKILVCTFWLYGLTIHKTFVLLVDRIMVDVNLLINLLFALATLWIPKPKRPILQSSLPVLS